jgi:broad specificity phosphatase PhoE
MCFVRFRNFLRPILKKEKLLIKVTFPIMDFVFIRHGESDNNVLREVLREEHGSPHDEVLFRQQRNHDPALTALGQLQVRVVAQRVQREYPNMSEVWVSFLSRALGTAAAVHAALPQTRVKVMSDINECGGSYRFCHDTQALVPDPGISRMEVLREYPTFTFFEPTQVGSEHEGWYKGSGKETHEDSHQRAMNLIARIEAAVADHHAAAPSSSPETAPPLVGVITHGDFFRLFLSELLRTNRFAATNEEDMTNRIRQKNTSKECGPVGASDAWVQNTAITRFSVRPRNSSSSSSCRTLHADNHDDHKTAPEASPRAEWHIALFADAEHLTQLNSFS